VFASANDNGISIVGRLKPTVSAEDADGGKSVDPRSA
jgi:hypothetical protein